jgi:xanthine dehydrogenase accessory factor
VKRDLLAALVAARQKNEPVVLVRGLNAGTQFIVTPNKSRGDIETIDTIDPILRDAARSALDKDGAHTIETEEDTYLLQTLAASPRIIIIGAVHIAQALIPMARTAGYDISLIDPRTAFANPQRFPKIEVDNRWPHEAFEEIKLDSRSAVVTLSHDPKIDEPALCAAMDSDAFYIGALGSKGNHKKRLERLKELGYDKKQLKRINGPIGLPLGGRSPAEIAVATLAQIIKARHRGVK